LYRCGKGAATRLFHFPGQRGQTRLFDTLFIIARLKGENGSNRLSEERYRALFAALPVPLQVVDGDGTILEVNPFHLAHMGGGRTTLADY
jgi:PAS domain-containing protein